MGRPYRPRDNVIGVDLGRCPRLVWSCAVGAEEGGVVRASRGLVGRDA